jgi:hypothetical protein
MKGPFAFNVLFKEKWYSQKLVLRRAFSLPGAPHTALMNNFQWQPIAILKATEKLL